MKATTRKVMNIGRTTAIAAAMISAGLFVALAETAREAEATFPGENGRIAFASNRTTGEGVNNPEGDSEIFTMNQDGTGLTQLTANAAFDSNPEWSPDGGRIAFESDRDLFSDIFVMDSDGSGQTNVTNNRAFDRSATFAPDGERIIFDSNLSAGVDNPTGDTEIFSVNLDGTDLAQLTNNTARDFHPDFAPDGRKIAFVSDRNFAPGIYTMSADGSKQKKINRGSGVAFASPGWSPDGSRITFASDQEGGHDVYVMRANGAGQQRLTVNGLPPTADLSSLRMVGRSPSSPTGTATSRSTPWAPTASTRLTSPTTRPQTSPPTGRLCRSDDRMGRRTMCRKTNTSYAPALQTERLSLRPLTRDDENALHRISNDPLVRQYLWDNEQVYAEAIRDLVQRSLHTFSDECVGVFGIRLRDSENLVGFCGFVRLEGMDELELAYELVPELWGRGLATEAARACVRYAFEEAGLRRVVAGADPPNVASVRVLEKLGMEPVGNINPLAPEEPYYALYEKGR